MCVHAAGFVILSATSRAGGLIVVDDDKTKTKRRRRSVGRYACYVTRYWFRGFNFFCCFRFGYRDEISARPRDGDTAAARVRRYSNVPRKTVFVYAGRVVEEIFAPWRKRYCGLRPPRVPPHPHDMRPLFARGRFARPSFPRDRITRT